MNIFDPPVWICGFCTLLAMIASANTLALRRYSRVRLEERFTRQGKRERIALFDNDEEALVSATALLRLLANIIVVLSIWKMSDRVAAKPWQSYLITLLGGGGVLMVFSVAIPNAWARYAAEPLLEFSYAALLSLRKVLSPIIAIVHIFDPFVRRLAGVAPGESDAAEEEILEAVTEGEREGVVDEGEKRMIENVLELDERTAGQVMTPRTEIHAVPLESTLIQVHKIIDEFGHSRLPVYDGSLDRVVGVLYAKDLLRYLENSTADFSITKTMRPAVFVPESKLLTDLLTELKGKKVHIAVVLDEYGGTAGLVTVEDILEEIVGEIEDEYEPTLPSEIRRIDSHTVEIDARARVDELNDQLDLHLPEDNDYETIGGFVSSHLGIIPEVGHSFAYNNNTYTVVDAEPRKINRLRLQLGEAVGK